MTDNECVRAGQVLTQLDQRDYRAALDHAEAALRARLAAVDSLRAQCALQQSTIRQQEADLAAKKARATFAEEDASRYRILAQTSSGWRQNEHPTSALHQEAQSAVVAVQAGIVAARQQLKVLELKPLRRCGRRASAIQQLWNLAYREASTLAFADAFRAIMLAFIVATLLVPLLRNIAAPTAPSSNAH